MKKLIQKYWFHVICIFGVSLFFIGFTFLYDTLDFLENITYGGKPSDFHLSMLYCISMVVLLITRTIFWRMNVKKPARWWEHLLWCVGEAYVISLFFAMYISLFSRIYYFACLPESLGYVYLSVVYPYSALVFVQALSEKSAPAAPAKEEDESERRIRFYDERHKLRLTLNTSSILKIAAEVNYVKIFYLEGGVLKNYLLRASMSSLESSCEKHGLVRCHRSFYINPEHVSTLSRDRDGGINATLDCENTEPVPVSKKYFAHISEIL